MDTVMTLPIASGLSGKFDPNSYEEPKHFRKNADGSYYPTDYQTALTLRKFMHDNNMPFISQAQIDDAANAGFLKLDENKTIALSDKEKAAFLQLKTAGTGLALRLDAGTTNTQDGWIGIQDINDAIKESWKLHGSDESEKGHWKVPFSDSKMTKEEVKQEVLKFMNEGGKTYIDPMNISIRLDNQSNEPRVLEALAILRRHSDEIDTDASYYLSIDEIKNWNTEV
jgi:hypothetical protein